MIDLAMLDKDDSRVTVDLSNVSRTGVQTVTSVIYGYTEEYFRQNVTVSDRTPSTITINVAELYHNCLLYTSCSSPPPRAASPVALTCLPW